MQRSTEPKAREFATLNQMTQFPVIHPPKYVREASSPRESESAPSLSYPQDVTRAKARRPYLSFVSGVAGPSKEFTGINRQQQKWRLCRLFFFFFFLIRIIESIFANTDDFRIYSLIGPVHLYIPPTGSRDLFLLLLKWIILRSSNPPKTAHSSRVKDFAREERHPRAVRRMARIWVSFSNIHDVIYYHSAGVTSSRLRTASRLPQHHRVDELLANVPRTLKQRPPLMCNAKKH